MQNVPPEKYILQMFQLLLVILCVYIYSFLLSLYRLCIIRCDPSAHASQFECSS